MPISKTGGREKGDLHVKFDVTFPSTLSEDKKRQLRAVLQG
jgi:DnaJ-class molecular chaperone